MKLLAILLAASTLLVSCKKNPSQPSPPPGTGTKLRVLLHGQYLDSTKVDSAIVTWNVNGTSIRKTMATSGNFLVATIQDPPQGQGSLTFTIFSRNTLDAQFLAYERVISDDLRRGVTYTVTAPNYLDDPNWLPRIIFNHRQPGGVFGVTALVGLRPSDPYFSFKDIDQEWRKRIILRRSYSHSSNPGAILANGVWQCQDTCTDDSGNYTNTTFFGFLPAHLNGRSWNTVSFLLRFYNTATSAGEMNFDHTF